MWFLDVSGIWVSHMQIDTVLKIEVKDSIFTWFGGLLLVLKVWQLFVVNLRAETRGSIIAVGPFTSRTRRCWLGALSGA